MKPSEFPLDKTNGRVSRLSTRPDQRPAVYRYVEAPEEGAATPGYNSLPDYWHILLRHKTTLFGFALAGLLGAILISLIQTPIYRVRTSLEIQGTNFETKGADPTSSGGGYSNPESYMETQVKLLQSEALLEHVVDKLKLHKEQPTGLRAIASRTLRMVKRSNLPEKEELIRQIERNLTVRTSGNSRLLEVLYESPDPTRPPDLANTLA